MKRSGSWTIPGYYGIIYPLTPDVSRASRHGLDIKLWEPWIEATARRGSGRRTRAKSDTVAFHMSRNHFILDEGAGELFFCNSEANTVAEHPWR